MDIPTATIAQDAPYYDSSGAAVGAAMKALKKLSDPYEYSGIIVKGADGRYQVSTPVTMRDEVNSSLKIPAELRPFLSDTYHSHPAAPGAVGYKLSKQDLAAIEQLGVPMHVLDRERNKILTQAPKPKAPVPVAAQVQQLSAPTAPVAPPPVASNVLPNQ